MVLSGLDASGLVLLNYRPGSEELNTAAHATVFASENGIIKLSRKLSEFETKNSTKRDGSVGRPSNADLAQSIHSITEAALRLLWRSPESRFPINNVVVQWEVWLWPNDIDRFVQGAQLIGLHVGLDRLEFPTDTVLIVTGTSEQIASAIRRYAGVKALATPASLPGFFDDLAPEDQSAWVNSLISKVSHQGTNQGTYVTLLDTGVSRAHPLIAPALDQADRHAADFAWSVDDSIGHGTQMAGLTLYGDLSIALQATTSLTIAHRLESAKIIPDTGVNFHHLLGTVTRNGVLAAEVNGERRRVFTLASTTNQDTPHDGAPTSWSAEVDQLCSGKGGGADLRRLMLVSAGNTDQNKFHDNDYLPICDHPDHEIESPAQAWNAISIGAFTEKATLSHGQLGSPYATVGDLSPSSRTANWSTTWPIKPDVVMEGGNWVVNGPFPPMKHEDLGLLTTHHTHPTRSFCTTADTSAATALAARAVAQLWTEYPTLWPETIRGLFVGSARWTLAMQAHLPQSPSKTSFAVLFKRYGYGVPDLDRAKKSATNSLTLVIQDAITPYGKSSNKGRDPINKEMRIFGLPWPTEGLRGLGNTQVTLRVTLSSFIEPSPSEPARGSKFRYASHNLRFKLNRANEIESQFIARISKTAEIEDETSIPDDSDDGWRFGVNRRDVGSLHIDELTCAASDLARRNILAVHPVAGWWKTKAVLKDHEKSARFALIVEISTDSEAIDLYAEVKTAIENQIATEITV